MARKQHGEIEAWQQADRTPVRLRWREGIITALEPARGNVPRRRWIAPPLLDLQINGFAGVDFQQDDVTQAGLLKAVRGLRAGGCTQFLLTLMTDQWPRLLARLQRLRHLRERSAELRHAILGWHLEGPFLSPEPGFCGAHDPSVMETVTPKHIREIQAVTGNDPVLLTISPAAYEAIAAIRTAVQGGMKVSLGHTNASAAWLKKAVAAGATGFTHLGNGCPPVLSRGDNILWRVLDTPGLTVSLIPDRVHVTPPVFRLFHRGLGPASIYYISDAMAAAGQRPGSYTLGRLKLEVGRDQIVRLPGTGNLAGSAVTPLDAVFHAAAMLRGDWQDAWRRFTEVPARLMGWSRRLTVGGPADFCWLELGRNNRLAKLTVYVGGSARPE